MFFNLTKNYFQNLFIVKNFIYVQIIFIANVFLVWTNYLDLIPPEKIKAICSMFIFPINIQFDLFRWLLLLLPFLIIVNIFINNALKENPVYYFLRIGNFSYLYHSIMFISFGFIFIQSLIGFILTGLIVYFIPITNSAVQNSEIVLLDTLSTSFSWKLFSHIFFIFVLSIILFILINTFFNFIIRNFNGAFFLTIICITSALPFGLMFPNLIDWNPLTYSLLAYHKLNNFTWQYIILCLCILTLYFVNSLIFHIKRENIVKI